MKKHGEKQPASQPKIRCSSTAIEIDSTHSCYRSTLSAPGKFIVMGYVWQCHREFVLVLSHTLICMVSHVLHAHKIYVFGWILKLNECWCWWCESAQLRRFRIDRFFGLLSMIFIFWTGDYRRKIECVNDINL